MRSFLPRRLAAILLFSVATLASAAVPLNDPPAILIPEGVTDEQAAAAIKVALGERGWIVSGERPGVIEGTLNIRVHTLQESFTYGQGRIAVKYLDSRLLDYEMKDGKPYIHSQFNNWNAALAKDIEATLQKVKADPAGILAAGENAARDLGPIKIAPVVRYENSSIGTEAVRGECTWNKSLVDVLVKASGSRVRVVDQAELSAPTGRSLDLYVHFIHAVGGGGAAGPSWAVLRGELREEGELVSNFEVTGKSMAPFRFTACSVLDKIAAQLGNWTSRWLREPREQQRKYAFAADSPAAQRHAGDPTPPEGDGAAAAPSGDATSEKSIQ
ncbi:MAG TPA: hypothetical protein VJM11_09950 [Nevskiaceae bacterium]|nr:hypothetical protein [Nevskiaceae bacterium]